MTYNSSNVTRVSHVLAATRAAFEILNTVTGSLKNYYALSTLHADVSSKK